MKIKFITKENNDIVFWGKARNGQDIRIVIDISNFLNEFSRFLMSNLK